MGDIGWDHAYVIKKVEMTRNLLRSYNFFKVLDVGSSTGVGQRPQYRLEKLSYFPLQSFFVHLDLNRSLLIKAKEVEKNSGYVLADAATLPFRSQAFDLVFSADVLKHLHKPEQALDEWQRVLDNKGHMVIFTPNISMSWNRLTRKIFKAPRGSTGDLDPGHVSLYDIRDLRRSLERRLLEIISIVGINLVGAGPIRLMVGTFRILLDKISLVASRRFNRMLFELGRNLSLISDSVLVHAARRATRSSCMRLTGC